MACRKINYYDFNLDLDPSQRWITIFDTFELNIPKLQKQIAKLFKAYEAILPIIKSMFNLINPSKIMFYAEIKYVAERMGMSICETILLQLIYETSSACTTGIFKVGDCEYFLRTMDWPMPFLKGITIGLNLMSNNKCIGKVIGWLGCVGFYTVETTDYAIAINYRRTQNMTIENIIVNAYKTLSMNWPISYLVRNVVEKGLTRIETIKTFEIAQLISPTYITVCAFNNGLISSADSVIITRDWDKLVSTRSDDLIQTNCDFDKCDPDILWSVERRELFRQIVEELNSLDKCSKKLILKRLMVTPILNDDLIYGYFSSGSKSIAFV